MTVAGTATTPASEAKISRRLSAAIAMCYFPFFDEALIVKVFVLLLAFTPLLRLTDTIARARSRLLRFTSRRAFLLSLILRVFDLPALSEKDLRPSRTFLRVFLAAL